MKKEPTEKTDEEVKESKSNAKKATKAANKKALKAASDKLLVTMAADMPGANASKSFLDLNGQLDKIELEAAKLNLAKRGVRGELRKMKVDLSALDRVRKLRKMEPEDVVAKKATEALYEEQLSMPLSDEQKAFLKALNAKREENKKAILAASGGNTGKEVGTGAANRVPERTDVAESERVEDNQSEIEQVIDPYAHAAGVRRH